LLLSTNIFVFPTFYEGFGLALTEAMASGHASVSYDIPVVREILGDSGAYVPLGDAVGMVDELARLVNAPEAIAAYAARAHERAARFSWRDAETSINQIIGDTMVGYEKQ
jgi:glycosyltransferase involved in cell wall biosynthesis